ncbi:hypothetical protein ACEZRV_000836 [Escherichia coli]
MKVSLLKNPKIFMDAEFTDGSPERLVFLKNSVTEVIFDGVDDDELFEFIFDERTVKGFYFHDFDGEKYTFLGE